MRRETHPQGTPTVLAEPAHGPRSPGPHESGVSSMTPKR
jgi:hypothetical protein